MNRSLTNVLFGGIAPIAQTPGQEIKGTITKTTVEETVEAMANAESVIIVRLLFSFTSVSIGQESPLSQLLWGPLTNLLLHMYYGRRWIGAQARASR
jgi:hypothetical protein